MKADIRFVNARIWTGDPRLPRSDRLAVWDGRVVALGEGADELESASEIDLGRAAVCPGFHDAHAHTTAYGLATEELDLSSSAVSSLNDLYAKVGERASNSGPGAWVLGSGYDQNKLGDAHPRRTELDRVAGEHPVWLKHVSGHMSVVNSAVLSRIGRRLSDAISGGAIERDDNGEPTGLLQEQAQHLVRDLIAPYPRDQLVAALARAHERYVAMGVTSVCDAGIGGGGVGHSGVELSAYQAAREAGYLKARTTTMVALEALHPVEANDADGVELGLDLGIRTGFGDDCLKVGAVKIFADGSLIGRTCFMREPFANDPTNRGFLQMEASRLRSSILAAHRSGWQVATHAIGDAAVDLVIDAYEEALANHPVTDHRHRIEHCGVTSPDAVKRIASLGIIPVPQGQFISEVGDGMAAALGPERIPRAYRMRSFLEAGIVLPGSSDLPVSSGRPLQGIQDMTNRRTASGFAFGPEETISVEDAIRAYTWGSAYATFFEQEVGILAPGMLADFVVLSEDPMTVDPDGIGDIAVLATAIGGRIVYEGTSG